MLYVLFFILLFFVRLVCASFIYYNSMKLKPCNVDDCVRGIGGGGYEWENWEFYRKMIQIVIGVFIWPITCHCLYILYGLEMNTEIIYLNWFCSHFCFFPLFFFVVFCSYSCYCFINCFVKRFYPFFNFFFFFFSYLLCYKWAI